MEKLLNLLNEYESESWIIKDEDIVKVGCDDYGLPCIDSYKQCIISKSYGFIDWLVDNDKIDFTKLKVNYIYHDDEGSWEKELLMQLAIQDNPIEYLCSILK